jgi:CBS domain-containing protein
MQEFADFLGSQSPYDALDADDLRALASAVEVEYFPARSLIFAPGAAPLDRLYVLRTGRVAMEDTGRVVDELDPGDTFGHVSVLSGMVPVLAARALTDVLCYLLPDPRPLLRHPERLRFQHYGRDVVRQRLTSDGLASGSGRGDDPVSRHASAAVRVGAGTTIREVAQAITDARQSCALVELGRPGAGAGWGIVTDADLRKAIGRPGFDPGAAAVSIASAPVLAVDAQTPVAVALQTMVEHGVHHLAVRSDGRLSGVVAVVDLASAEVRDPLMVRSAISGAADLADLARAAHLLPATAVELVDAGLPASRVGALIAAVMEAVVRRALELGAAPLPDGVDCSWLLLGSLARREALISSDLDTAVVFSPGEVETQEIVRVTAGDLLGHLERCGLPRCANGSNATSALFARSRQGWAAASSGWLADPGGDRALLLSTMLLDCRPVNDPALGRAVTGDLLAAGTTPQFRAALLEYTVNARPPVGFVREFVVEHSGSHEGSLNLKRGGLRPVASLGRWVAMVTGDATGTTPQRLLRGVDAGLLGQTEAQALAGAFEHVYEVLLRREADAVRAGETPDEYLDPRHLDPLERRHLRESFRAIDHVQSRLTSQWSSRVR